MRVALVDPSLFTLPYDVALARGLSQAGCAVTLHGRKPQPADGGDGGIDIAGHFYPIAETRLARTLPKPFRLAIKGVDHFASMRRLLRILRAQKPDIIHFQWLPLPTIDSTLLQSFRRVAPVILTVHDTNPFNGDPAARLQRAGTLRALSGADHLIVHTAQGRERLASLGISRDRINILPHGSLSQLGAPSGAGPAPAHAEDNLQGVLTLLLFGKIKPYKGADLLIEAYAALPPRLRAQARIRIVGRPYMDLAALHNQAKALGVEHAVSIEPGFIDDSQIDQLFAPDSIAVFPYREIEASGVLSYAIANGRPIIASALGSFAETLTDGLHGHIVPVGNVEALKGAIAAMLTDRQATIVFAREVAKLAHCIASWDDIAEQTIQIYGLATQIAPPHASSARALTHRPSLSQA